VSEIRMLRRIADELSRASGSLEDPNEATALWAAAQGVKPAEVWLLRESEPAPDVAKRFWQTVEQRKRGVRFAYTVGRTGFRTLDLAIDPRALIPRPETEGLVDLVLKHGSRDRGPRGGHRHRLRVHCAGARCRRQLRESGRRGAVSSRRGAGA